MTQHQFRMYEDEIDQILIDSFYPYANLIKENGEAILECEEHFKTRFHMDSKELDRELGRPF